MGIADYCEHDSRGNKIPFDDIPKIQQQYIKVKTKKMSNMIVLDSPRIAVSWKIILLFQSITTTDCCRIKQDKKDT